MLPQDESEMKTLVPTGGTENAICYGSGHPECECYANELPRDLPVYIEDSTVYPKEILVLCDLCRARLEGLGEIAVPPAGVLPTQPSDFPPSAFD